MIRISENLSRNSLKWRLRQLQPSANEIIADLSFNNIKVLLNFFPLYFVFLRELFLDNCHINIIIHNTFENLCFLEKLSMNGNHIKYLHDKLFIKNRNLKMLYLKSNKIEVVSTKFIDNIANLMVLKLDWNKIRKFSNNNAPNLQYLFLNNNRIGEFNNNNFPELLGLSFYENKIEKLQKNMFEMCTKLEFVNFDKNLINEIEFNAFYDLQKLKLLTINFNLLNKISDFDFQRNLELNELYLKNNHIKKISNKAFENLKFLTAINLSNNRIEKINSSHFAHNTFLAFLNLTGNNLYDIDRSALKKLTNLITFECDWNKQKFIIENELFENNTQLIMISMVNSNIIEICDKAFHRLYKLHTLDLSFNFIKELSHNCLPEYCEALKLNLSHNSLSLIEIDHLKNRKLTELNLAVNCNLFIKYKSFQDQTKMLILDLSNVSFLINKLPKLDFIYLEELYLVSCSIYKFENRYFRRLRNLRNLNLSHNSLRFPKMEHLGKMSICMHSNVVFTKMSNKPIRGKTIINSIFRSLHNLTFLILTNCDIIKVNANVFNRFANILIIDLSDNYIKFLSLNTFKNLITLKKLFLQDNILTKFDFQMIQSNINLEVLDLCLNDIPALIVNENEYVGSLKQIIIDNTCKYPETFFLIRNIQVLHESFRDYLI